MILVNLRWARDREGDIPERHRKEHAPPTTASLMVYPHVTDEYIIDSETGYCWKIVRIFHPINGGPPMVEVE